MTKKKHMVPDSDGMFNTKLGSYDMKAKVVAEKLKGKKDLEVIRWAKEELNFLIQYRRNIYRWRQNPIILKLGKQYAGLIEDADIPDKIKYGYRVISPKGDDVYDMLVEYIDIALQCEIPIDEQFIEAKFAQFREISELASEDTSVSPTALEKLKLHYRQAIASKVQKAGGSNSKTVENSNLSRGGRPADIDEAKPFGDSKVLKSSTKQLLIDNLQDLQAIFYQYDWKNTYNVLESTISCSLVDSQKMDQYGLVNFDPSFEISETNEEDPKLSMILCGNFDGSHKCKCTFIGLNEKPRKLSILSSNCNYYHNKTEWFFASYLKALDEEIKIHNRVHFNKRNSSTDRTINSSDKSASSNDREPNTVLVLCDENYCREITDNAIPDSMKLVVIRQDFYSQIEGISEWGITLQKHFQSKVLANVLETIKNISELTSLKKLETEDMMTLIASMELPAVDTMNILNKLWSEWPNYFFRVFGHHFSGFSPNVDVDYLSNQQENSKNCTKYTSYEGLIKASQQDVENLLEKINDQAVIANSIFHRLENILSLNLQQTEVSRLLQVEALKATALQNDFIYRKVVSQQKWKNNVIRLLLEDAEKIGEDKPITKSSFKKKKKTLWKVHNQVLVFLQFNKRVNLKNHFLKHPKFYQYPPC